MRSIYDELDAVVGHEAGHFRHGHFWVYLTFLLGGFALLGVALNAWGEVRWATAWFGGQGPKVVLTIAGAATCSSASGWCRGAASARPMWPVAGRRRWRPAIPG